RGLVSFLALLLAAPILTVAMIAVYTVIGQVLQWPQANPSYTLYASMRGGFGGPPIAQQGGSANYALIQPETAVLLPLILVPFVAFCVAVGLGYSVTKRTVFSAVIWTIAVVGLLALFLGACGSVSAQQIALLGP